MKLKQPAALKKQVQKLELRENFAKVNAAMRDRHLREQRANLVNEMQRLQSTANQITPGLREYLAQRAATVRGLNRMLNK
jgi:hypothetical protein